MKKAIRRFKKTKTVGYAYDFGKYLFVGIIWTLLNIFLMWLFIDILGFSTVTGATIVVIGVFFGKYYSYRIIKLIKDQFTKYAVTNIAFSAAQIPLMWLFVDFVGISVVISSTIITVALYILRFICFYAVGLIKKR